MAYVIAEPCIDFKDKACVASFGCIGNRVYTGADDTEAYFAIPGLQLGAVEEKLAVIVRANQEMEKFHRERAAATPTA
jgi:uncharacterized protein (DUF169 family)